MHATGDVITIAISRSVYKSFPSLSYYSWQEGSEWTLAICTILYFFFSAISYCWYCFFFSIIIMQNYLSEKYLCICLCVVLQINGLTGVTGVTAGNLTEGWIAVPVREGSILCWPNWTYDEMKEKLEWLETPNKHDSLNKQVIIRGSSFPWHEFSHNYNII